MESALRACGRPVRKQLRALKSAPGQCTTASQHRRTVLPSISVEREVGTSKVHLFPLIMTKETAKWASEIVAEKTPYEHVPIELELFEAVYQRHLLRQKIFGEPALPTTTTRDSYTTFHSLSNGFTYQQTHYLRPHQPSFIDWAALPEDFRKDFKTAEQIAFSEIHNSKHTTAEPTLKLDELNPELRSVFEHASHSDASDQEVRDSDADGSARLNTQDPTTASKKLLKKQLRIAQKKENRKNAKEKIRSKLQLDEAIAGPYTVQPNLVENGGAHFASTIKSTFVMTSEASNTAPVDTESQSSTPAQHKPLVVGRTKPRPNSTSNMDAPTESTTSGTKAELNHAIEENLKNNTTAAAPADDSASQSTKKKEKAAKQPKAPKAAPPSAPLTPALIDLRVGHILRAIAHPNADSLFVSTIAMGDPEGTDHTQVDEETGKVVRTVCSGLNGLVPLEEMQNRKVIVVANLKPVNMRSIKSAAMVLAASPQAEEGADPHAADRIVELVSPPEGSEAGDKVFFEGWPYGDGRGPEKQLNPKKKQWEAIQPGFYTSENCVVGFDSEKSEILGIEKGDLIVEGKGHCTVRSLKGAVVR